MHYELGEEDDTALNCVKKISNTADEIDYNLTKGTVDDNGLI